MTIARLASYRKTCKSTSQQAVDKWQIYRWLCTGKTVLGVKDRTLAVLNALLSFYPESTLSKGDRLVVFPSNRQLSLRSHGMPDTTLRRHLALLVDAGLILRRDSPNGKRYARKGRAGDVEEAFGFSLAPLIVRAEEFQATAEKIEADAMALKVMRERVTLYRRDITKLMECAKLSGNEAQWASIFHEFRNIVETIPRRASLPVLISIVEELASIRMKVDKFLENIENSQKVDGNDIQNGRQYLTSESESIIETIPTTVTVDRTLEQKSHSRTNQAGFPLDMVLKACPQINDYARGGKVREWQDLVYAANVVRSMFGVSQSAYHQACSVMGSQNTAIILACILEKGPHISSVGGYLRDLTNRSRQGKFTTRPMLMALLRAQQISKQRQTQPTNGSHSISIVTSERQIEYNAYERRRLSAIPCVPSNET